MFTPTRLRRFLPAAPPLTAFLLAAGLTLPAIAQTAPPDPAPNAAPNPAPTTGPPPTVRRSNQQTLALTAPLDSLVRVTLQNSTVLVGRLRERTPTGITLETKEVGRVTIPYEQIDRFEVVPTGALRNGQIWLANPHATRYLFSPTAIPLGKGEGYYQNTYISINSVQIGLSKHFSLGGGVELLTLAMGHPIFFVTPRVGFQVAPKVHVGGGMWLGGIPIDGFHTFGFTYGNVTLGTRETNLTLNLGTGFIDGRFARRPIASLSGMHRVGRRLALISENWLVPTQRTEGYSGYNSTTNQSTHPQKTTYSTYGIVSYGIRIFGERMAFDLALINSKDIFDDLPIGVPFVNFVYKF